MEEFLDVTIYKFEDLVRNEKINVKKYPDIFRRRAAKDCGLEFNEQFIKFFEAMPGMNDSDRYTEAVAFARVPTRYNEQNFTLAYQLYYAIKNRFPQDVVQQLMENYDSSIEGYYFFEALNEAAVAGNIRIIEFILAKTNSDGKGIFSEASENDDYSFLPVLGYKGHNIDECVKLLRAGAKTMIADFDSQMAVINAAIKYIKTGDKAAFKTKVSRDEDEDVFEYNHEVIYIVSRVAGMVGDSKLAVKIIKDSPRVINNAKLAKSIIGGALYAGQDAFITEKLTRYLSPQTMDRKFYDELADCGNVEIFKLVAGTREAELAPKLLTSPTNKPLFRYIVKNYPEKAKKLNDLIGIENDPLKVAYWTYLGKTVEFSDQSDVGGPNLESFDFLASKSVPQLPKETVKIVLETFGLI